MLDTKQLIVIETFATAQPASPAPLFDRDFYMRQRDAYLVLVDTIERALGISPRTVELRANYKKIIKEPHK